MSSKSRKQKLPPIAADFCQDSLRSLVACSDELISRALAELPGYDLGRLDRLSRVARERRDRGAGK